jgi:hypothetical protein
VNQVLIAYGDVEDALTDLHALSDVVGHLRERTLLTNQLSLAQAVNLHVAASIRLIKALGGGWNPSEDSPAR